jgi:hypothetical protein
MLSVNLPFNLYNIFKSVSARNELIGHYHLRQQFLPHNTITDVSYQFKENHFN